VTATEIVLERAEGTSSTLTLWQAAEATAPVVLVVPAMGMLSSYYHRFGEALAAAGLHCALMELRGHEAEGGRTPGRDYDFGYVDMVGDVTDALDATRKTLPEAPVVLLGHSMGGGVALSYTIEHEDALDALVLSAPLAALEAASPVQRAAGRVLSVVAPRLGVVAIDSTAVSRDPKVVEDYDADPLNYHGKLPARTVAELTSAIDGYPEAVKRFRLPMLVLHGTADRLTPIAGSEMVVANAASDDKTFKRYDGLFHEILNEPEREEVLSDIAAWLDDRFPAG
jgi:alpha-beta hydrolase superfamily lysophospholipase